MKRWMIIAAMLFSGCSLPHNPAPPAPKSSPRPSPPYRFDVLPLVLTHAGLTDWSEQDLRKQCDFAASVMAQAQIILNFQPTEKQEDIDHQQIDNGDEVAFLDMQAANLASSRRVLTIHFVGHMTVGKQAYRGLTSLPSQSIPWGCLIAQASPVWTVAHELGHAFGLQHLTTAFDCASVNHCNLMNLCDDMALPSCQNVILHPDQIATMQLWASQAPRSNLLN